MQQLKLVMQQMINISEAEQNEFLRQAAVKRVKRNELISQPNTIQNEIFFINKGLVRLIITNKKGDEHTVYFAMENQFITDYASFLQKTPSIYTLQALEDTELVVIPRSSIEWGYKNVKEGEKMGRLIAEYYFIVKEEHIKNKHSYTPKQRYDTIGSVFPNIHNRAPQHMIASYLGITPVHLSRLKNPRDK